MEEKPVGATGVTVVLTLTILIFWLEVLPGEVSTVRYTFNNPGPALQQPEPRARDAALVKGCASRARDPWPLSFLPP